MSKAKKPREIITLDKKTGEVELLPQHKTGRPLFRTPYNQDEFKFVGEKSDKPSDTIPEQSLSIKQLLHRYSRGLPLDAPIQNAVYDGEEEEYPDLARLDLSERQELLEQARAETKRIQKQLEENAARRNQKRAEAAREQEKKKWALEYEANRNKQGQSNKDQNPENPPSEL